MKKEITTLGVFAAILAVIPHIGFWIDKSYTHTGIGIVAFLWIVLCPIYFLITGITLGKRYKSKFVWALPIIYIAAIYVANSLMTSFDIWIYFVTYFMITYAAMGVTAFMQKNKRSNPEVYKKAIKVVVIALIVMAVSVVLFIVSMIVTNSVSSTLVTDVAIDITYEDDVHDNNIEIFHDLSKDGSVTVPLLDLNEYTFKTNSEKISVKMESEQSFELEIVLFDAKDNDTILQQTTLDNFDLEANDTALFTNLTSAMTYRFESNVANNNILITISE
ncbi:MAG: hypothetical protein R3Y09_00630 [Clostridia bacterium]